MSKEKIKVYLYTRVSTTMQIDGYSLDAQKIKMKAFCDYNEYEIAGEYEDAGKSGKSIEGRVSFNQMMGGNFIIQFLWITFEKFSHLIKFTKRGNIAHVSSFLTLIGVIHFP